MTNSMTPSDRAQARLAQFVRGIEPPLSPAFPIKFGGLSGLATTYIIGRNDGGVGASTVALMLEYFHHTRVVIIQVGGLKSWAYKGRECADYIHIKPHEDEDRFSPPIDVRIRQPDRVAIIEYEHAMAREAIKAASLVTHTFQAFAPLFLIASLHDHDFGLPAIARRQNIEPIILRQPGAAPVHDKEVVKVPSIPMKLATSLRRDPMNFEALPDAWYSPVAALTFRDNLEVFKRAIAERMA